MKKETKYSIPRETLIVIQDFTNDYTDYYTRDLFTSQESLNNEINKIIREHHTNDDDLINDLTIKIYELQQSKKTENVLKDVEVLPF